MSAGRPDLDERAQGGDRIRERAQEAGAERRDSGSTVPRRVTNHGDSYRVAVTIGRMEPNDSEAGVADERRPGSILLLVLLVLGIWLALGTFLGIQSYLNAGIDGRSLTLAAALNTSIRRYLIYAVLTFPCLWLCRRFPFTSRRWGVPLLAHSAGLVAFSVLYAPLRLLIGPVLSGSTLERLPATLATGMLLIRANLFEHFWMYSSMVTAILSIQHYRQLRRRELREAELKRQVAEYRL